VTTFQADQVFNLEGSLANNIFKFEIILIYFDKDIVLKRVHLKLKRIVPSWIKNPLC